MRHYSVNEGLPSSETYTVFQDSKGYIWIASDMGVSRFDGYNFKVFTTEDGLTDNTVFRFYEDPKGRIWCCTFSGRLCYYFNDTIYGRDFKLNDRINSLLGPGVIHFLKVDDKDTVFVSSSKGLLKLIPGIENGIRGWYNMQIVSKENSYAYEHFYFTFKAVAENKSVATRYTSGHTPVETFLPRSVSSIQTVCEFKDGTLMVFFTDEVLTIDTIGNVTSRGRRISTVSGLEESDSTVWLGQIRGGIHLFGKKDYSKPLKGFLESFSVSDVLKDRENGYWFCTTDDGLFYLPSYAVTSYTTDSDTLINKELALAVLGKHKIWSISNHAIYEHQDTDGFKRLAASERKDFWPVNGENIFWNAHRHSDGSIWVSTHAGLTIFDSTCTRRLKSIYLYPDKTALYHDSRVVYEDEQGDIWSLNHANIAKIDHLTYNVVQTTLTPSRAESLCGDYHGNILIGAVNGLYRLKGDSIFYMGDLNPVFRSRFVDVKQRNGKIVGATRGAGIVIIAGDSVYRVTKNLGLRSNMCRSVFVDEQNMIWVATNNGLNVIRYTENPFKATVTSFSAADGLPSNDIAQVTKDGNRIWLLTKKGICSFDPVKLIENKFPPPVFITKLRIDNKIHPLANTPEVDYSANFITVEFVGLTYKNAGRQDYKYKLEGYDTSWTYTKNTFVQFTKLPPGNYRFIVSCINNSGVESSNPAVFAFKVNAPFYQKWWFYLILSLSFVGVVVLVSVVYIRRIREQERVKTEVNRKIANLELQALRAQMNPHFVFNCLAAIQDFILNNEPLPAKYYLSSFSKLVRKTLDNSRKQNIPLTEEIEFLYLYLELERMRFVEKFSYEITVTDEVKRMNIEIPSMILQPFIENAIRHSRIGSLPRQGQLKIDFSITGNDLLCCIDDNGIGVNQSLREKAGRPGPEGVHAFDIISDRVRTINEIHQSDIRYKIIDKFDIGETESGTRVTIHMPVWDGE